jgi:hypothetical protein
MSEVKEQCPRCREYTLHPTEVMNALCRRDNKTYICSPCGSEQAMEDYANREVNPNERVSFVNLDNPVVQSLLLERTERTTKIIEENIQTMEEVKKTMALLIDYKDYIQECIYDLEEEIGGSLEYKRIPLNYREFSEDAELQGLGFWKTGWEK